MSPERLQKVLASAGVASRRDCEVLITSGRVTVNGRVVRTLGTRVDMDQDIVAVDGTPVDQPDQRTYIMLNKPVGVVSTVDDPQGRTTVIDLVESPTRIFPVGRLDVDSEGLLLLTDDGALTHCLTHPSYEVEKEYRALLDYEPDANALDRWRRGVMLDGEQTAPAEVDVIEHTDDGVWVRVVLHEGRKRQIREVARLLGYKVQRLIRVREDHLYLGKLLPGQWRLLRPEEVQILRSHLKNADYDTNVANKQLAVGTQTMPNSLEASTMDNDTPSIDTPAEEGKPVTPAHHTTAREHRPQRPRPRTTSPRGHNHRNAEQAGSSGPARHSPSSTRRNQSPSGERRSSDGRRDERYSDRPRRESNRYDDRPNRSRTNQPRDGTASQNNNRQYGAQSGRTERYGERRHGNQSSRDRTGRQTGARRDNAPYKEHRGNQYGSPYRGNRSNGPDEQISPDSGNRRQRPDRSTPEEKPSPNRAWRERQDEEARARQNRFGRRNWRAEHNRAQARPDNRSTARRQSERPRRNEDETTE